MQGRAQFLLALVAGTTAIACVAAPFAVVGQRHAPRPVALAPITRTTPPPSTVVATTVSSTGAPTPAAPIVHVFRVADLASDPQLSIVNGTVGKRPFLAALTSAGITPKEAHRVLGAYGGVRNLDRCDPRDAFTFAKATDGHVVAFELIPHAAGEGDELVIFQAREEADKELAAKRVSIPIAREHLAMGLVVSDDLRGSISRAHSGDGNEQLLSLIDDALDGRAELSDLRAGTRLRLVATEERIEGKFTGWTSLDAVEYAAAGKPALRIYWFAKGSSQPLPHAKANDRDHADHAEHHGGFYDAQGRQPYHGGWRSPVPMARISSRFNPNRMHPVLHVVMPHNGIDFAAPPGTPIYAAASGVIRSVGDGGPCGNMVQIDHPNGLTSAYCHMSRFAPGLAVGEHVETRQLVGYVGQTGRATGPHLHFAVKRGEMFLDPLTMKLDGVRLVPPKLKGDFDELRQKLDADLDAIVLPEATKSESDGGAPSDPTDDGQEQP